MCDAHELVDLYEAMRKKLTKSKSVVVVGAGATGVELCGEIKTEPATKHVDVTLINRGDKFVWKVGPCRTPLTPCRRMAGSRRSDLDPGPRSKPSLHGT